MAKILEIRKCSACDRLKHDIANNKISKNAIVHAFKFVSKSFRSPYIGYSNWSLSRSGCNEISVAPITYIPGTILEEPNASYTKECSGGIHCASLEWCCDPSPNPYWGSSYPWPIAYVKLEFQVKDITYIGYNKIVLKRCKVVCPVDKNGVELPLSYDAPILEVGDFVHTNSCWILGKMNDKLYTLELPSYDPAKVVQVGQKDQVYIDRGVSSIESPYEVSGFDLVKWDPHNSYKPDVTYKWYSELLEKRSAE